MQRGFTPILIVLLVAVLGIGGYFVYTNYSNNQTKPPTQSTTYSTPQPSPSTDETANWKTYTDIKYGFSLKYPTAFQFENKLSDPPMVFVGLINDTSKAAKASDVLEGGSETEKANPYLVISVTPTELSLSNYINNHELWSQAKNETVNGNVFTVVKEVRQEISGPDLSVYLIKHEGNIIEISNSAYPVDDAIFNQILSTFIFTQ